MKKVFRTAQSELPCLKNVKDSVYFHMRRLLGIVHETDFRALTSIPGWPAEGLCIDVGANQGQSIESILQVRPEARIISFEASPNLAQALTIRYNRNPNISIVAKGLSDRAGTLTLFVPSYKGFVYDGLASFDRAAAASWINGQRVFGFDPSKLNIAAVTCEVSTLDTQQVAPIFIKVDVQGYEYQVLSGGLDTMRMYEPVLMVESFRNDPRTVQLVDTLGYEEYYFDGAFLRKGSPTRSPNSFLMTPARARCVLH